MRANPLSHHTPRYALETSPFSIILTQPIKAGHIPRTIEIPIPYFLRQNPRRHPSLPIPLRRTLRRPSPIEPSPSSLIRAHLRLGICHEPSLVGIAV